MWVPKDIYSQQRKLKKSLKLNYSPCFFPTLELAQKDVLKFARKPIIFECKEGYFTTTVTDENVLIERGHPHIK